jgi:hypothetical protein
VQTVGEPQDTPDRRSFAGWLRAVQRSPFQRQTPVLQGGRLCPSVMQVVDERQDTLLRPRLDDGPFLSDHS